MRSQALKCSLHRIINLNTLQDVRKVAVICQFLSVVAVTKQKIYSSVLVVAENRESKTIAWEGVDGKAFETNLVATKRPSL